MDFSRAVVMQTAMVSTFAFQAGPGCWRTCEAALSGAVLRGRRITGIGVLCHLEATDDVSKAVPFHAYVGALLQDLAFILRLSVNVALSAPTCSFEVPVLRKIA